MFEVWSTRNRGLIFFERTDFEVRRWFEWVARHFSRIRMKQRHLFCGQFETLGSSVKEAHEKLIKFIWVCLSLLCCFTLFESFSGTFVYVFFPFVFSRSQSSRINMDLDDRGLLKGALRQRTIRKKLQRAPNSKIQSSVRFKVYSFTHHLEGYFRVIFYTEYLHYSTIPSEDFHWFAVRQDESRGGRCAKDFWRIPRFCGCRSTHLFGHSGGAWIFCHFFILWLPNVYCKWSMQTWKKKGRLLPLFSSFFHLKC